MGDKAADSRDSRHWQPRPGWSISIRLLAFAVPLLASVLTGSVLSHLLPTPNTPLELVGWWAAILLGATVAVIGTDRYARRLLPLATLMRLSIIFPDHAPSRLKVARRFAGSRAIAAELDRAHREGVTGDRQEAAETILALVGALGEYDSRTRGHSERTQLFVTMLAEELKLRDEDRGKLMWAALVHDIGKLKVPHEVLNKPAAPTEEEWQVLHSHPVQGAQICEPLREWLGPWWLAIEQHHERYDGKGYPRGLAGKEISYGARIVSVADSYEVMTSPRPYKVPMTAAAARQELTRCAGSQFDPDVVRAFLNLSLGRNRRLSAPLAWLAQVLLVRPGPMLGNVLGTASGVGAAAAGVVALSLAPTVADATTLHRDRGADAPVVSTQGPDGSTPGSTAPGASTPSDDSNDPSGSPTPSSGAVPTRTSDPDSPGVTPGGPTRPAPTTAGPTPSTSVPGGGPGGHPGPGGNPSTTGRPGGTTGPPSTSTGGPSPSTPPPPVPPLAQADAATVQEDGLGVVDVTANDRVGDDGPLRLASVSGAALGSASVTANGEVRYVPDPDVHGVDTLSYTARDAKGQKTSATLTITVAPVNDAPVARPDSYSGRTAVALNVGAANGVLANDDDIDGDRLTVTGDDNLLVDIRSDGSIRYLPVLPGRITVHYTVSDGTASRTGTVTITITLL